MRAPSFRSRYFWGVRDHAAFNAALDQLVASAQFDNHWFASDNLIAFGRNLGFLDDAAFLTAFNAHAKDGFERGVLWRTVSVVWGARQASRLEGGFIECGCYKGTTALIMLDAAGVTDREVFLYDLFEHDASMDHHAMPEHGPDLFAFVAARFADRPNVKVVKGCLPQSFEQGLPERIAFAHIDMNSARGEIETLEAIESRLVPGAVIVLDDFGASAYRQQHVLETRWFQQRGRHVLELPTSQGLVIW
ncbi:MULTISPECIES: class I SAM-dependent methyltransferase [unclassified Phenylobacterium]|uniref:class I SAM-dependent methyltransferase n=1 Tax=unclassified Phenylobacterium TaxID=2640670 RepID=UPI00083A669B|nr:MULTISPECIES: class I SAM-dependent methyltransferase [unclassified Phenylobacterium]